MPYSDPRKRRERVMRWKVANRAKVLEQKRGWRDRLRAHPQKRRESLFINVTKTEAMLFGTAARLASTDSFNIHIDGKQIERVHEFTYLGI